MKRESHPLPGSASSGIVPLHQPPTIRQFRHIVLDHYRNHGRDLAWRRTTDPYRILVSEMMLQQTQVERVSVKYPVFTTTFPDFSSLAKAPLPDVLALWQGLGYNRRALSLQRCAGLVVEDYNSMLPQDPDILATFPGIGRATAASVCAFAFNMPVVFIETNIRRVFIHFFFDGSATVDDADILPLATKALYRKDPRIWYNALMDFGSDLKRTVKNPNRRSRHYAKQAAFEGSDRKIRGSILRILLAEKRMTQKAIKKRFSEDPSRIIRILCDLEHEGFIVRSGAYVAIASR
jgi:A/G-specific adenine glycosylase